MVTNSLDVSGYIVRIVLSPSEYCPLGPPGSYIIFEQLVIDVLPVCDMI